MTARVVLHAAAAMPDPTTRSAFTILLTLFSLLLWGCALDDEAEIDGSEEGTLAATTGENLWTGAGFAPWFWVRADQNPQLVGGAWSFASLQPGKQYRITFQVSSIDARVALYVGERRVDLTRTGSYSYDFEVADRRRIVFESLTLVGGRNRVGVNQIDVRQVATAKSPRRGHYISFGKFVDLKAELTDILDTPGPYSNFEVTQANKLRDTLTAPGVRGLWMPVAWEKIEVADGVFDWSVPDTIVATARRFGLRAVIEISDRSFNGRNIMPDYFPSQYAIAVGGRTPDLDGFVAKKWSPYVYNRLIRLYRAVGNRYDANPSFEGLATGETALGKFDSAAHGYTAAAFEEALVQIVNQSKSAFPTSKLFLYMNYIAGGTRRDLSQDARTRVLHRTVGGPVVYGGPDVWADYGDHVRFYRYAETIHPAAPKFCHAQHEDHKAPKTNAERDAFYNATGTHRDEILRDPSGTRVTRHPQWTIGRFWTPRETFRYGTENWDCEYFFWHYHIWGNQKDAVGTEEYHTDDVLPLIANTPTF